MLSTFQHPASVSFGNPVEGVPAVQGFSNADTMARLIPAFKLPDRGGKADDEEKPQHSDTIELVDSERKENGLPELFQFTISVNFDEIIALLLEPDQVEALQVRNKIKMEKGGDNILYLSPGGLKPKELHPFIEKLYKFQFQLFETSKGLHFHVII